MGYLWLGILAGLASSPHCLGMCGPFSLHLSRSHQGYRALLSLLIYVSGKALTYAFLGTVFGFAGAWLVRSARFTFAQDLLAYLSGGLLAIFGLMLLGLVPNRLVLSDPDACGSVLRPLFRHFLATPGPRAALLLGVLTGYLPCPITLALLAAAAASRSALSGLLLLAGLGLGSAPALLALGFSGSLAVRSRRVSLRAAGALLILLGVITALRPTHLLCRVLPVFTSFFPRGLWS